MKKVVSALQQKTDSELSEFQVSGIINVCGHDLTPQEVNLKYAFDDKAKDNSHKYEAHSNGDVSGEELFYCSILIESHFAFFRKQRYSTVDIPKIWQP